MKYYLNPNIDYEKLWSNVKIRDNKLFHKSAFSDFFIKFDKGYEAEVQHGYLVIIPENDPDDGLHFQRNELLTENEYNKLKHNKKFDEKMTKLLKKDTE